MDGPHSDIKLKGKADLAEARVHVADPVLETFRIKCAHVPGEDEMDEIANHFALFFWAGMQLKHPRPKAGAVPARGPAIRSACLLLMETIMLSLSRRFGPHQCVQRIIHSRARAGFTLVEIVIALAVLGVM